MSTLLDILKPALRRAGISQMPGVVPSTDKTTELIPEVNRLLGSWSCDGHKIFTTKSEKFDLVNGQKEYTIGPGGDLDTARPIYIKAANFIFPGRPEVYVKIQILDDDEWSRISVQDITAAPPWYLYYDGSYNSDGQGRILIVGQPPDGYQLQLYTWEALADSFTTTGDAVIWPPGYEDALVSNLGMRVCSLYPLESVTARNKFAHQELKDEAQKSLRTLIVLNSNSPVLRSEAANIGGRGRGGMLMPLIFSGGGSQGLSWVATNTPPDGSRTEFVFDFQPVYVLYNGVTLIAGTGFVSPAINTIRIINNAGFTVTPSIGDGVWGATPVSSSMTGAASTTTANQAVATDFVVTGSIDGTNGFDGNASFTLDTTPVFLQVWKNGNLQAYGTAYYRTGVTLIFLPGYIPVAGDTLAASGTYVP